MKRHVLVLPMLLSLANFGGCNVRLMQIESNLCSSLVLREGQQNGQEAICLLRVGTVPRNLLPSELGNVPLREKLALLGHPHAVRQSPVGKARYTFNASGVEIEAECEESLSDSGGCLWFLRISRAQGRIKVNDRLQETLDLLKRNGLRTGSVSFEAGDNPSAGEYLRVAVLEGILDQIEWRDPQGVAGFAAPNWSQTVKQ